MTSTVGDSRTCDAARDGLVAADVADRHRAGDDLAAVQVDRAQAAAGRAIVGGVLVPEEDDDDLAGVDRREQRARRVAGRGVVGEAGLRGLGHRGGRGGLAPAWPLAGLAGDRLGGLGGGLGGRGAAWRPKACGGGGGRAADGVGRGLAARGGGVRGVDGAVRLGHALARPVTPGGVAAGSTSAAGLGRSTRNHTTAKTSATIRTMRKGRLILSTPSLSAARADS